MNDRKLRRELDQVSGRYRRVLTRGMHAAWWASLGCMGVAVMGYTRGAFGAETRDLWTVLGGIAVVPAVVTLLVKARIKTVSDPLWVARKVEAKFPDLDTRLLASFDLKGEGGGEGLGYLEQSVIDQSVEHARRRGWGALVPDSKLRLAAVANFVGVLFLGGVVVGMAADYVRRPKTPVPEKIADVVKPEVAPFEIKVVPENTELERGTALLVTAEFNRARLPGDVQLVYKEGDEGEPIATAMSKSLDDPVFALRVPGVKKDLSYAIRYGDKQTQWYKATVFDFPALKQADADLKFPGYTGQPEKTLEDTRSISAVEGTQAGLTFKLNKPVVSARLVPEKRAPARGAKGEAAAAAAAATQPVASMEPIELKVDPADPSVFTLGMELKQSQAYRLELVDASKRQNKDSARLTINVLANRPVEVKMAQPARDVDVSPIEELTVKANVKDDFGVKRVGISYGIAGDTAKEVILAENVPGGEKRDVTKVISLEDLKAVPDQLLTYYMWAEDVGPDGKVRRTSGDMFFADVRPFEAIYRQGQQPAGGEDQQQQQRQQQQGQQGQQGAQQRQQQLAEQQKQLIAATWKVIRRETGQSPTPEFVPDVKLLQEEQTAAQEKAAALGEEATDDRVKAIADDLMKQMDKAVEQLTKAGTTPAIKDLPDALSAQQAAYQDLLKMRAREAEVVRGNRQQQQQGNQSSQQARQQQQLNQLDLANQQNRYQQQQRAPQLSQQQQQNQRQEQDAQSAETRQVLSRLRELAQRQEDLNRQMREMQSSLQQAQTQAERDELQRQLARLRDQQQEMLRDTDELRDRLDQPQNQQNENLAQASQQLDQTRENERRAADQLGQGQLAQAQAAGQRAQEQLNNLKEDVRREAAGQFSDAMTQMRQDARDLDQNQQQLAQRMQQLDQPATPAAERPPGLRGAAQQPGGERQQLAQDLDAERQALEKILEQMKTTVEQAETSEPVLSRQLYDTIRQTSQAETGKALDTSRDLLQRGLNQEARQTEADAGKSITRLRQGVEQAAASVLGDETESMRRARAELDRTIQQLQNEIDRQGAATRPALANGQPTTRPGENPQQLAQAGGRNGTPNERQLLQQPDGQQPNPQNGQPGQQGQPGERQNQQPGGRQGAQQPGGQQAGGQQANAQSSERQLQQPGQGRGQQPGQQAGRGQQPGQQGEGEQPGQQANGQQPGGQGRGQQPGGAQANAQQPGQGRGQQPGQGRGQQPGQGRGQQANGQQPGQGRGQPGAGRNGQPQNGQQPGEQQAAGQNPDGQNPDGQQPGQGQARGQQPGGRQGGQQANGRGNQPGGRQGGQPGGQARGGQPGGRQGAGGQPQDGQQPDEQQANADNPQGQQPDEEQAVQGQVPQGQGGQARGNQPGGRQGGAQARGNQPGGRQGGAQARAGQPGQRGGQPGQRGGQAGQRGGQPGDPQQGDPQQGDPQLAQGQDPQNPDGQQPQEGQPGQRGGQPGQAGQPGQGGQRGGRQGGGPRQGGQVARGGRAGGLNNQQIPNNQQNPDDQQAAQGQVDPAQPQLAQGNQVRQPNQADAERNLQDLANQLNNPDTTAGPLTGTGFRDWSDRLRDVEEMVTDPRLRAEAARIRERATAIRAEFNQHSAPPNWDVVQETIGKPLAELRDAIALELLKKDSATALVPIDREPVPPEYAEQVRKYYERLGSGK